MILRFADDLSWMDIIANGNELAAYLGMDRDERGKRVYEHPQDRERHVVRIPRPVLVTDAWRLAQLDPLTRDTAFRLYDSPTRTTEYDGTGIAFTQSRYPGVWGPSIDTLLFANALRNLARDGRLASVRTAAELGAGSGFLAKYLLAKAPAIEQATLVDFNPAATACQRACVDDPRARFVTGDAVDHIASERYDLVLCNPPYIPRPKSVDDNPYEGVGLLRTLIGRAPTYLREGGLLVTNVSSLCEDLIAPDLERRNVRELTRMEVPLKVLNVLHNPEWMAYLHARGLKRESRDGYEHWHHIRILAITP